MKLLFATVLAIASFAASAQLTSEEKSLLKSSISVDTAKQMGKADDAAGLARIVALGDPELVTSFAIGMSHSEPLSPEIERQVVLYFNDPRVGRALRALASRYQTRALFDKFYAAAQATYESRDPVFEHILRTDQPGIDDALLRLAPRFPVRPQSLNPALEFLGKRKYPGAVEPLLAALEATDWGNSYSSAPWLLLHYNSPDIWRRTSDVIERMHAAGKMADGPYKSARSQLDAALKDPDAALARNRAEENMAAYQRRTSELNPILADATRLRSDPPRYIDAQAKYLAKLDAFATGLGDPAVTSRLSFEYTRLGLFALLRANDPKAAVPFLEKAASSYEVLGTVALSDIFEQGLGDKAAAIRTYQAALDATTEVKGQIKPYSPPFGPTGDPMNEFWKAWFSAEIEFLKTGKTFRGRVSEPVITGFWTFMSWSRGSHALFAQALRDATPSRPTVAAAAPKQASSGAPNYSGFGLTNDSLVRSDWATVEQKYWNSIGPEQASWLDQLPASRMSLLISIGEVSALDDPAAILSRLARDDPSGFWTAIIMGTVDYHESHDRDDALDDGVAVLLPGMAAPTKPKPLAVAAKRYMQSQGLRVAEKK